MDRLIPIVNNEWYHVYNRGNDRRTLFRDADDYRAFVTKQDATLVRYQVGRIAWVLMPNHFHFILKQRPEGSLARMMDSLETSYAKRFNLRYRHTGHVFEGRYRYTHIPDNESLWNVARYVHLNPVRAGLVVRPEDWEFSDFGKPQTKASFNSGQSQMKDALTSALTSEDYAAFVQQGVKDIEALRRFLFETA